ncbi:MAG: pyridoxamine 5'-phosphate oxidase family protein [Rhodospirillales bacterium]|nr:pyridoxamine 5'-phosphate oxidase family protein [Rhodospirillales bacterium]MBO6786319.1 pyridoxamine 5'-phosphate oxidase family protein [Rhodospirillales bacterium]
MSDYIIDSIETLEEIYSSPAEASLVKESTTITDEYRRLIEASPFVALASSGPEGLDCSPRGDLKGFVRIHDEKTVMIPDRRGNNRVDTLRNIVRDPRVALLFLIPGSGTTLRINGHARLSTDPALLESFAEQGKSPRSVIIVDVETTYFQCARAILRAKLWDPAEHQDPKSLPSPGDILAAQTKSRDDGGIDGEAYDAEWPGRAAKSLW